MKLSDYRLFGTGPRIPAFMVSDYGACAKWSRGFTFSVAAVLWLAMMVAIVATASR